MEERRKRKVVVYECACGQELYGFYLCPVCGKRATKFKGVVVYQDLKKKGIIKGFKSKNL